MSLNNGKTLLFNLIDDFKAHKLKFRLTSNTTVFDSSTSSLGLYLRYVPLHKTEFESFLNKGNFAFYNLPCRYDDFFSKYISFMNTLKTGLNNIYGYLLTFYYPNKVIEKNLCHSFIKKYVKELSDGIDLPYLVRNIEYPNGYFVELLIIDRLYLKNIKYKIYPSNKYIDIRTGKFAKKDCDAKYKKVKCKKGDFIRDKNGNKIRVNNQFSVSLRHFSFAKDMKTKKNLFSEFIYMLKQKYLNALQIVTVGKGARKGIRFKKTITKSTYHVFVRRRIAAINYAKQSIEYILNYFLQLEKSKDTIYEHFKDGKSNKILHTNAYKSLLSLGFKMKKRFQSGYFHDGEGKLRKINYYNMRVDELDKNIQVLLECFSDELFEIYDSIPLIA